MTLDHIGHLEVIKEEYERRYISNFTDQIIDKARTAPDGAISEAIPEEYYDFTDVAWAHGTSTVKAWYEGNVYTDRHSGGRYTNGTLRLQFKDRFTDPIDIRQVLVGAINIPKKFEEFVRRRLGVANDTFIGRFNEGNLLDIIQEASEIRGTAYDITGHWTADIQLAL